LDRDSQWKGVRKPQKAAAPKSMMKTTPVRRPEGAVLLQDWSTAIAQTRKRKIAQVPRTFNNMFTPVHSVSTQWDVRNEFPESSKSVQ